MGPRVRLSAPAPLADGHQLAAFNSGVPILDDWLKRRARANQVSGASRSFVICADDIVVGYYALASGAVSAAESNSLQAVTTALYNHAPAQRGRY